jgi:phenylalanyl-tRNA synthetase beta chain
MRLSLNWLKELVDIDASPEAFSHQLTMLGLEIESMARPGAEIRGVKVGRILSIDRHPDADRLVVCKTDVGESEPLQIVCGATNMKEGDLVPTATVGGTLPGGFEIGRRKMRGIESSGMMCSSNELGLGEDHSGLLILDPATPIGADAVPLLGLDDTVFEIEVTPNRNDWASMIGIAREVAALYGSSFRIPEAGLTEGSTSAGQLSSVTIEAPDLCPRYAGRVLLNVKPGPSPRWMCQRLIAGGMRPISNIVDITNYVLLETGHPLHAFDYDKLGENRIVVRRAKAGECIKTIDEQNRELDADMLVIADAKRPVAVAGVMGGHDSEVGGTTTRIFLESAFFNPASVRRTARALGMQTEASTRFQRGADPEMVHHAVDRAAALMAELACAEVAEGILDEYPAPSGPIEVTLKYERTTRLLGTQITPDRQRKYLSRLGFDVSTSGDDACIAKTPSWRHDVSHEADLIEEVARLYGYENAAISVPAIPPVEEVFSPHTKRLRSLRALLTGYGYTEFTSWTFSNPKAIANACIGVPDEAVVALQNPLSDRHTVMRPSLIPGMLTAVSSNLRHGNLNVMAFELGPVYLQGQNQELPDEPTRLIIALSGHRGEKHWSGPQETLDFFDLKGVVEAMLQSLAGVDCEFNHATSDTFLPDQCAEVLLGKAGLGSLGRVKDSILKAFDIDQPVYLAELDVNATLHLQGTAPEFETIAKFPPSRRDMAVLVDAAVQAGDVRKTAQKAGGKLLGRVDLFDVYTGKQVPEGMKSLALSLVFQSEERTLTDKDTQKMWDRILKALTKEFEAELR